MKIDGGAQHGSIPRLTNPNGVQHGRGGAPRVTFTEGGQGVSANRAAPPGAGMPYIVPMPGGRGVPANRADLGPRPFATPTEGARGASAGRDGLPGGRPRVRVNTGGHGVSINRAGVPGARPLVHDQVGGRGVAVNRVAPTLAPEGEPIPLTGERLVPWFHALAKRLEKVYVLNKDWADVLSDSVAGTTASSPGECAIFLDPPYATEGRSEVYGADSLSVAGQVFEWATAPERNRPDWRICVAGYAGDYPQFPAGWERVVWRTSQTRMGATQGAVYDRTECLWFSPSCLDPATQPALLI